MSISECIAHTIESCKPCESFRRAQTHRAKSATLSRRLNIPAKGSILAIVCYNPRRDAERRCETIANGIKKYGYGATLRALHNALRQAERAFAKDSRIVATIRADIQVIVASPPE